MLSNLSNNNNGNKTKSVVEKKHYEEIENRLDEMQTDIDANSSAIAQNASDIETLDDRIDAVEENSTFESISTDTIYPATGQTVKVDGDELVTGTLAAHDINTTNLKVNNVDFDDVVDNSVTALTNSRAANYTANQARTKANEVDLKVDNLISSMAQELDTDLLKADTVNTDTLSADIATVDEITSHSITTDVLSADLVKAVGQLVRPTIGQSYYTITFPENTIATLNGKYTIGGVDKKIFLSVNPSNVYYFQESLEIIKTISFDRHSGAVRVVLKLDSDLNYISIDNGNDTVTIEDGDNPFSNYEFEPEKLRGIITHGFWTNETETVVTGILKAYQLQAENEHFESTSVDDLFIEKSLNVPEQWDQSGIACFSSGLPDQYLSIDTMDGVTHPRWKDSANEATGTLNETNRLVTEESVAKWNGTSCDGTDEYYPITNIGDNAEVHGSATVDGDLTVTGSAHLNADEAIKLHTARCINGTAFDGTSDITTSKWGTERVVTVQDNDGSNSTTTCVDGSTDFTLSLPATIKADVDGTACNAKCVEIKADSCNAEYNIPFETTSNATYQELGKDTCLKFNPSTNQLSTDRLCGTECVDTPLLKATQADITCNFTVGKNAVIAGDLTVAGTMHVNETENISTGADIITMRTNNNSSLGTGCVSGLFINNYDGSNSMVIGTDKNGTFRVGDSAGSSTSYAEIYTDDEHWYNGTYPNGVQFTFSGSLTSYSSLRIETDTSVTPPKTYKIYDDAVITSVDISDMEPLATRAEATDMQNGYVSVWDSTGTDLVTNVNEAKVHGLVSDCKVCGVDFHGTNFNGTNFNGTNFCGTNVCGTNVYGCLHGNVDGNAATASTVATACNTTNATFYPTFVDSNNGTAANESVYTDADLNYNPNTNVLSVPNVKASGKVCGGCFTSDDTVTVKVECNNELNIYTTFGDAAWINYRGGANRVVIGDGDGNSSCCGTVVAATFCGNLCGCFCGCKWYDDSFTGNTDANVALSNGSANTVNVHGVSTVCSLTYNPATGVTKMSGHVCAGYTYSISNSLSWTTRKYIKITRKSSDPCVIQARSYSANYTIAIDETPSITTDTGYGIEGFWRQAPNNFSLWIKVIGYSPIEFFSSGPLDFTETTTQPTGAVWSSPRKINSQVETTATSCNANYYLTFVDSNNGTADAENVYTNGGLYYNPGICRLSNVGSAACSFLDPDNLNLSGATPMIDLRYGNYTGDYTTRLIDSRRGEFDIIVNEGFGSTTATRTSTFSFYSNGCFFARCEVASHNISSVIPSDNTASDLTFTAIQNNNRILCSRRMCLCGANGVLYNPQGFNGPVTVMPQPMTYINASTSKVDNVIGLRYSGYNESNSGYPSTWGTILTTQSGVGINDRWGYQIARPTESCHFFYRSWVNHDCTTNAWDQFIDSTGGQTIAGNLTVHNSSNNATLTADCFCGRINFNYVEDAYLRCVARGDVYRKVYSRSKISGEGYVQSIAIGQCRTVGWGRALISVGNNDAGTSWVDYTFDVNGYMTAPTGYATSTGFTLTSNATCPISLTCGNYKIQLNNDDATLVGFDTSASQGSTAIGVCTKATGTCATAIGCEACACGDASVAIGSDTHANSTDSIAVGSFAETTACDSIAIGCSACTECKDAIAIGTGACAGEKDSIAIGRGAKTSSAGTIIDCHVVYSTGASAHFYWSCMQPQNAIYADLACMGRRYSPMWPIGCGCTYCGRLMVPARWIIRNGTYSEAGNWLSWDGDGNIDLTGTVLGSDHAICGTSQSGMGGRLEIWADWSFDYWHCRL